MHRTLSSRIPRLTDYNYDIPRRRHAQISHAKRSIEAALARALTLHTGQFLVFISLFSFRYSISSNTVERFLSQDRRRLEEFYDMRRSLHPCISISVKNDQDNLLDSPIREQVGDIIRYPAPSFYFSNLACLVY